MMTIRSFLLDMTELLEQSGIQTARLDVLVLLEDIFGKDRAWILAHDEIELPDVQIDILAKAIRQRCTHEPLAYIRGVSEFYGRSFMVAPGVLIPRPESEDIIEMLCSVVKTSKLITPNIVDIGTGSGALAITAKCEIPKAKIFATDIDVICLNIARENAKNHMATIELLQGNLLEPVPRLLTRSDTILMANLPYVPDNYSVNKAAQYEPKHALFGGADGLDLYREFFAQAAQMTPTPAYVLTESLPFQHSLLSNIAINHGYRMAQQQNFIQLFVLNN